ncbi:TolC family protein [Tepidibacillus sp. HK-1]|uniref:TolC family protein n=1 Tax=Tepidibacillus sp. HK-1 TaxID=1883407 RepID=UPI0008537214|nr:TolC family protein [Tepidibacillus sp. HK-1]GBF12286.1 outer membrane channel protein [Tepidibacillus sp. HK-1]
MLKNNKIFIITLITLLSFISFPRANSLIIDSMDFQGEATELTLNQAIDLMLKDNPTMEQQKLDLEQAQVDYDKAKYNLRKLKPLYEDKRKDSIDYLQNYRLLEVSTEFTKANAERNAQATTEGLKAQVEESYYKLLQAEQLLKIKKENLDTYKKLYETTKKKLELGLVTKQEVLSAELNVINAENDYNATKDMLTKAKMAFNVTLGKDVMDQVNLKDQLTPKEFKEVSIADAINQAFEKRNEIKIAEYGYEMAKINFDIISKQYPEITFQYRSEKVNLDKAIKSLETTKKQIEMEVRSNYLDVKQKQSEIKAYEKSVTIAEEGLKLNQLLYDNGMGVATDVEKAQVQLDQAKVGLAQSILDYNLAVLKFEDSIDVGRTAMSIPFS